MGATAPVVRKLRPVVDNEKYSAGRQALNQPIEEREALAALEADFAANLAQVEEVHAGYVQARRRIETLVSISAADAGALSQEEISGIMAATCPPGTFDPVLGTLAALISSGRLGILRHAPLRGALTNFQNLVVDAAEDAALVQADARDVGKAELEGKHHRAYVHAHGKFGHVADYSNPTFVLCIREQHGSFTVVTACFAGLRFYTSISPSLI